jgi:hypothetical protein
MTRLFNVYPACTSLLLLALTGCIEGTYDHSKTLDYQNADMGAPTIAVATIPESAALEGLSKTLTAALVFELESKLTSSHVQGPNKLNESLVSNDVLEDFSRWRSTYRQTGVLPHQSPAFKKAINTRYLLLPIDTYVDREKITGADAECPSICFYDRDNIWRTRLKVLIELIDLEKNTVIWRGLGEARHIQDGGPSFDWRIVQYIPGKGPEVETLAGRMINIVAQGIAREIGSLFRQS